jgi:ABC-type nickel/cobalt efflux system permease component RcnA
MDGLVAAYAAALALGATHALEVDHMVAVNAFLGNRPRVATAVGFGVRWALGHGAIVLLAGVLLAATGVTIAGPVVEWAEIGVGVMLVALGLWAIRATRRLHVHTPADHGDHAHLHAHDPGSHPHHHTHDQATHRHRHLSTLVGAAHGLAGAAPVVALMPVTLLDGFWAAVGYLVAFGVGTMAAMGVYAGLAAVAVARLGSSVRTARVVAGITAGGSIAVGVWWMLRGVLG